MCRPSTTVARRCRTSRASVTRAELVVGELTAHAVLHGRVSGRCFRLTLAFDPAAGRLRLEVTDARGDRCPQLPPADAEPDALHPSRRGLALVAGNADRWDTIPCPPIGKTVRAVLSMLIEA
ncbi:ATP-binding protein [Streptomyces sp. NPDC002596]